METKKYSKVNWFDRELLTHQGEILLYHLNENMPFHPEDNHWFEGENKLYFKPHFQNMISSPLGEVVYYHLAKKIGLNPLQSRPAYLALSNFVGQNGYEGSVSKNFIGKNQKLVLAGDLNISKIDVDTVVSQLKKYCLNLEKIKKMFVECDFKSIEKDLKKVALLDFLTIIKDRHRGNFGFLVTTKKDKITVELAPIFDNAMIFSLNSKNMAAYLSNKIKKNDFSEIEKHLTHYFPMLTLNPVLKSDNESKALIANQFAGEMKRNEELAKCFNKLKKVSFDNLLKEIQKDIPNYPLNSDDFLLMQTFFGFQTKQIETGLNFSKKDYGNEIQK